jgi:hypothetical protein
MAVQCRSDAKNAKQDPVLCVWLDTGHPSCQYALAVPNAKRTATGPFCIRRRITGGTTAWPTWWIHTKHPVAKCSRAGRLSKPSACRTRP